MKKFIMLHGVNHNMFGKRDPKQYGTITLDEIDESIQKLAQELNVEVETFQTNHEGEMVEKIHEVFLNKLDGVIINAGAWTHYSYAIMDALAILSIPVVEVHMSNVHAREEFRHMSLLSPLAAGIIVGCGTDGYGLALRRIAAQPTSAQQTCTRNPEENAR